MKYTKAVDLWNISNLEAVVSGKLKLQRGQWVRCGNSRPSRFVTVMNSGSVWAVHPMTSSGRDSAQNKKFMQIVNSFKKA